VPCRDGSTPQLTPLVDAAPEGDAWLHGGALEKAATMANCASTRTTQLYDRRREELTLDEVERIRI
jgi:hypothetical protein